MCFGYHNKAIIYNNTFINNEYGVSIYGSPDTLSVYNNIFYSHYLAMYQSNRTYSGFINLSYIDNNYWNPSFPSYRLPYIDNGVEKSVIIGDSVWYTGDSLFMNEYYDLSENSIAIDKGSKVIPAFAYSFSVLDTVITADSEITLTGYRGAAPDLGAREYGEPSDVQQTEKLPDSFELYQNYPNPFNPVTLIQFSIPSGISPVKVSLKIYDILGREVGTLVNEEKPAGIYKVNFDGSSFASGIYFYRLQAGKFVQARKLILLK